MSRHNTRCFDAYTATDRVTIPDVRIRSLPVGADTVPLRGYGYLVGVVAGEYFIGWADKDEVQ